jgi:hypothetical protein
MAMYLAKFTHTPQAWAGLTWMRFTGSGCGE